MNFVHCCVFAEQGVNHVWGDKDRNGARAGGDFAAVVVASIIEVVIY